MNDKELLNHLSKSAKDDFNYFSNSNKEVRELWVASEFMSKINVDYHDQEFVSPEQSSKIDVIFRDASFQIKEIPDQNIRRGKLYKDVDRSLNEASSLEDISLVGDVQDIPPIVKTYDLVLEKAEDLAKSKKYMETKGELDLLIYVTRPRASFIQEDEIDSDDFISMGWRTVSCVNSKQAVVLFSSQNGPHFLREIQGIVKEKMANKRVQGNRII